MILQNAPLVSVVVVSYDRLALLRRTVSSFLNKSTYPRTSLELILCDDGSPQSVQEQMRTLPFGLFLMSSQNCGIAHNTNKGLRAASGQYILQLQDDWECTGPADFIEVAIDLFTEREDVALVRLQDPFDGPHESCVLQPKGRTAHIYSKHQHWRATAGEYVYSDNPHIKRRRLHEILGFYAEGKPMHLTEMDFCRRFEKQPDMMAAFVDGYSCFLHTGLGSSFNPVHKEPQVRKLVKQLPGAILALKCLHSARNVIMRRVIHNSFRRT